MFLFEDTTRKRRDFFLFLKFSFFPTLNRDWCDKANKLPKGKGKKKKKIKTKKLSYPW